MYEKKLLSHNNYDKITSFKQLFIFIDVVIIFNMLMK